MLTVITGAPCSGKTTYALEHAQPGDIIIDLDRITDALSAPGQDRYDAPDELRRVAMDARRAALTSALRSTADVYVIDSKPTPERHAEYRMVNARYVNVDPGMDVCLERAERERPAEFQVYIQRHYATQ